MAALSENDKLDRLAAELEGDDSSPETGGAVDQNDIDALLAEFQNAATAAPEPKPSAKKRADANGSGDSPMGQSEIDRLLAGGDSADEAELAPTPSAEDTAAADIPAAELSDQEKMDRLIAELQEESHTAADQGTGPATEVEMTAEEAVPASDPEPAPGVNGASALMAEAPVTDTDEAGAGLVEDLASQTAQNPLEDFDALDDDEIDLDGYEDRAPKPALATPAAEPEAPVTEPVAQEISGQDENGALETAPEAVVAPAPEALPSEAALELRLERRKVRRRAVALDEKRTTRFWPRYLISAAVLIAAAIGGAAGYRAFDARQRAADLPSEAAKSAGAQPQQSASEPAPLPNNASQVAPSLQESLDGRFARIDAARQAMIEKQNEILQLRGEYEAGIREIEADIVREAQALGVKRYPEATAVKAIDYGLRTIQRRLDYIKKLETPVQRLHDGSEAMLYAKRLASVNLLLVGLAEGIDSTVIGQQMDAALAAHPVADVLQLETAEGKPDASLETIWQRIVARMGSAGSAAAPAAAGAVTTAKTGADDDARIWNALCEGDFGDKYQLTALSAAAAACLAGWQGSELFLNRLRQLNPQEAAALSVWKGQWLAMNRIDTLSVAATQALFQWPGTRLSLNGLRQLPDGAAEAVANWPGKEMELMGLERLNLPMAKAIAHWKRAGGRLFVPEKFYRKQ
ncbi:MAG: hypothetical protein ABIL58_15990 [Pseudomonadota bacterium]